MTTRTCLALGVVTFLLMLPETLPVPVLRGLVVQRFDLDATSASWFMAANMVGALIAAPLVGLCVDRFGGRRRLAILATLADAGLMQGLAHPHTYATFLLLRCVEGAAHITALTMVMSLVADAAGDRRGRAMGCLGAGLTLGVATGAALGGLIGRDDPVRTLHVGTWVLVVAGAVAWWLLPRDTAASRHPAYRQVLAALRRVPGIRLPLLLAFVDRFTVGFFTTGFPLLLEGVHGATRPHIGMLLAAFLYPFALLSYPCGRLAERVSRPRLVFWGSLLYGTAVIGVALVPVPALWGLMPLIGVASAVMFVPTLLWLLEQAPDVGRSTAMASFHAAGSLGFLLGPLCCGALIDLGGGQLGGHRLAFAVAGVAEIVGAMLVVAVLRGWHTRS